MAEDERRLARHVPVHRFAGTQAAGADADEQTAGAVLGERDGLEAQVVRTVEDDGAGLGYAHPVASGRIAYFTPLPRSREAKTSTMLGRSRTPLMIGRTSMTPVASRRYASSTSFGR